MSDRGNAISLYHYTDQDGYDALWNVPKLLNPSPDGLEGSGVYFVNVAPEDVHSRDELADFIWGGGADKLDYVAIIHLFEEQLDEFNPHIPDLIYFSHPENRYVKQERNHYVYRGKIGYDELIATDIPD